MIKSVFVRLDVLVTTARISNTNTEPVRIH